MKLTKVASTPRAETAVAASTAGTGAAIRRRDFLRNSGLLAGGAAVAAGLAPKMVKKAQATDAPAPSGGETKQVRTICTHCSVGCGVYAEVKNGVWTGRMRPSTIPSTAAPTAPRARRCASTATASAGSSTR
jgi:formate dehydrogenase major subunit